jgi:hypothetical protein
MHRANVSPNRWLDSLPGRTVIQGILIDVLLTVSFVLYDALSHDNVNWKLLGVLVGKTALMALASSIMKRVRPPT